MNIFPKDIERLIIKIWFDEVKEELLNITKGVKIDLDLEDFINDKYRLVKLDNCWDYLPNLE